jgi:integrase/recombinase XerD
MKSKVSVSKIEHKGENRLMLKFAYNANAGNAINKLAFSAWSETLKSWLLPFNKDSVKALKEIFLEIEFEDSASAMMAHGEENNNKDEVFIWEDSDYLYVKLKKINWNDKSFLSGLELNRNYQASGYWKIKNSPSTNSLIRNHFNNRLTQWPSLKEEIKYYEEKLQNRNKITAVVISNKVRVIFDWNQQVIDFLKTMPFHSWDPGNSWWTFAYNERSLKAFNDFCLENKYDLTIDRISALKRLSMRSIDYHDPMHRKCPPEMIEKLTNRRYSKSTIKQYCSMFEEFINYHRKLALEELGTPEIKEFIGYLVQERRVSSSYQNLAVNAIKFYYEKVLGGPRRIIDFDRPRREKKLPEVLSRDEVISMLSAVTNPKHKFILILLYSTGIRRGELLQLKPGDIDRENMQIWIRGGKGKKDRYVQLGKSVLRFMDEYIGLFNPKEYLIEGLREKYSATSVAEIIKTAAKKAGITRRVTAHKFRHSYATHMLEDGIDTRFIQELLGHESIRTTQIYSHVTDKNIKNLSNPFDKLKI